MNTTNKAENDIVVTPTSSNSAIVKRLIIEETERLRFSIVATLVNNPNNEDNSVAIKLIYEKKKQADELFPSDNPNYQGEKLSRQGIKVGDWIELNLRTEATRVLQEKLEDLYSFHKENGIPYTSGVFSRYDAHLKKLIKRFQERPDIIHQLSDETNDELISTLLRIITQTSSKEKIQSALNLMEEEELEIMFASCNMTMLSQLAVQMRKNMDNPNEEFWQKDIFSEYSWVLGQIFSTPCTLFAEKAYVGGKSIDNSNGNICDFIYQNKLTEGVSLIEIKTPKTKLIGERYRGTHSLSSELSGAINQVINYKDSLTKNFSHLRASSENNFQVYNPQCVVIAGKIADLNSKERKTFENFRNTFNNITIITYDELLEKIEALISIISN